MGLFDALGVVINPKRRFDGGGTVGTPRGAVKLGVFLCSRARSMTRDQYRERPGNLAAALRRST